MISPYAREVHKKYLVLPCGRCIGCRLDYSRDWANRCMLELQYHDSAYFVTLTYDDLHLPINHYADSETGEIGVTATLDKKEFQDFMKRLREHHCRKFGNDATLRFFAAGEYGSKTRRPHYHAIIYGLKLDDLKFYKRNSFPENYDLYNSEWISKIWGKGHVVVGKVNWDTCAYTARYIVKKQYGNSSQIYEKYNFVPEFTLMSRRPGIGRDYFEEKKESIKNKLRDNDVILISDGDRVREARPPKYYERLLEPDEPELMSELKETRQRIAADLVEAKLDQTSLDYLEMLKSEEANKLASISALKRKEI
ncbi:replication initiator protein [Chimpanzee faeces associated microphage 2]|uniref:replication initiator protein n=1 Tax=Chimpanzee faeces associated microphage 2 TaxID=1676182 RepID=UPI0007FB6B8C|nr:replication initiator protein [Chimpanzee faeces associated microphage 2]AKO71493.1 replication initiator protein [Chimpanzee faeces associated microphage 2]